MAWSAPGLYGAGGRDELRLLLAADRSPAAIDGAAAMLQGRPGAKPDPELEKFIAQWRPTTARNPREAMGV